MPHPHPHGPGGHVHVGPNHCGHIHGPWPRPYPGYPYPPPIFDPCPSPYPPVVINVNYPAYLCIASSTGDDEDHVVEPWGYYGHDGGQWSYDYIDAENWALEQCELYHQDCYLVTCFTY
jgi:hypothetical protein